MWRNLTDSKHYENGVFVNTSPTPVMLPGLSFSKVWKDYINRPKSVVPPNPLPTIKTDLKTIDSLSYNAPVVVWFGHSSYLIAYKGLQIPVDPVFSDHASPIPGFFKAFPGTTIFATDDLPVIDFLILSHNHYDHLDKDTLNRLQSRINKIFVPLGAGKDIQACGIDTRKITVQELDWGESEVLNPGLRLTATPARHFSGRGLKRNGSLWNSYVLELETFKLFLGGDSGFDTHFKEIGDKEGPFDLAILECGQYSPSWPFIHTTSEETLAAARDLKAKVLLPVHWAKFALSNHPWDEPIKRLLQEAQNQDDSPNVTTPLIGEALIVDSKCPASRWWEGVL